MRILFYHIFIYNSEIGEILSLLGGEFVYLQK